MTIPTTTPSTQLPFELDPQIIHHIIYSQAGSIGKAIIELIMNSVDSGSTAVRLVLDGSGFSAVDDGKGFASREDVVRYFGRFGTPHQEGDATFGRFRLGRGQIMAHASTVWSSNFWQMEVDTHAMGYNYQLTDLQTAHPGCSITGTWYEPLDNTETLSVLQEIRDLVRYTPLTVELNGKVISKDPAKETWGYEDANCYLRVRAEGAMHIYNQGVFVRHDAAHVWGVGGTVVTKKPIGLNVSRTEILRKTCPVWKEIAAVLKKEAAQFAETSDQRRKTEARREKNAKALLAGTGNLDQIYSGEEVITMLPGTRHMSLSEFVRRYGQLQDLSIADTDDLSAGRDHHKLVTIVERDEQVGKAEKMAFSLSNMAFVHPKTLARFDCQSAAEFKEALECIFENFRAAESRYAEQLKHPCYAEYGVLAANYKPNYEILTAAAIKDKNLRSAWQALKWCLESYTATYFSEGAYYPGARGYRGRYLNVLLAESNSAQAWTDGASYIAINKGLVAAIGGRESLQAVSRIFAIVDHELAHDGDSVGASHDDTFHARYHEISLAMASWKMFYVQCWLRKYTYALEGRGKPKSRWNYTSELMDRASKARHKDKLPGVAASIEGISALQRLESVEDPKIAATVNMQLIQAGYQPTTNWAQVVDAALKGSEFQIAAQFAVDVERVRRVLGNRAAERFGEIHEAKLVRKEDFLREGAFGEPEVIARLSTERLPDADGDLADWLDAVIAEAVKQRFDWCRICFAPASVREIAELFAPLSLDEWEGVVAAHPEWHKADGQEKNSGHSAQGELDDAIYSFLRGKGVIGCADEGFVYGSAWAMLEETPRGDWQVVFEQRILPRMVELSLSLSLDLDADSPSSDLEEDDDAGAFWRNYANLLIKHGAAKDELADHAGELGFGLTVLDAAGYVESDQQRTSELLAAFNRYAAKHGLTLVKVAQSSTTPAHQGFEEAVGRAPENQDEARAWERAERPRLQAGETMWSLERNANAVGFHRVADYIKWRGDFELYYPHKVAAPAV